MAVWAGKSAPCPFSAFLQIVKRESGMKKVLTQPPKADRVSINGVRFQSREWTLFWSSTCDRNRIRFKSSSRGSFGGNAAQRMQMLHLRVESRNHFTSGRKF